MTTTINLQEICIANGLGVLLLMIMTYSNRRRLREKTRENRILILMIVCTIISCLVDPIDMAVDGKPGPFNRFLVFAGNQWMFFANLIIAPCWIAFLREHLHMRLQRWHVIVIAVLEAIGVLLLIANCFYPIAFGVLENNVYYRGPAYLYFVAFVLLLVADSVGIYLRTRSIGGMLKFFPVAVFIGPVLLGIAIQSFVYGVTTIWPCVAVSMCGVFAGLQNELIYRDKLTGLYNRFYMDDLKKEIGDSVKSSYSAVMLDLNGFKAINDMHGHQAGDTALIETADILRTAVGSLGSVIRYAGDEFIVLLNTCQAEIVEGCVAAIRRGFAEFNEKGGKPYSLSASVGWCRFDMKDMSVEQVLKEVDARMFEDKRAFYEQRTNDRRRR